MKQRFLLASAFFLVLTAFSRWTMLSVEAAFPGANGLIAFQSDRDGDNDIYVMSANGAGQVALTVNSADDIGPRWSPDGLQIVFTSNRGGDEEIFSMNGDGSGQVQLTTMTGRSPAWSRDGAKLTFTSQRDGNDEIYVMNANGSGQTRLTNDPAVDRDPVWSPDGSRLLFSSDRDGDFELYVMNADGTNVTQLTSDVSIDEIQPNWSPSGAKVVYARGLSGTPELDVWMMNADGSGQAQVTNDPAVDSQPEFSPDGTRILFSSDRFGDVGIFVMNADGAGVTPLTVNSASEASADWQPVLSGPVSRWEGQLNYLDSIGSHHAEPGPFGGPGFVPGRVGAAFYYAVLSQLNVPDHPSFDPGSQITIDAWINPLEISHDVSILQKHSGVDGTGGYRFGTTQAPYGPANGLQFALDLSGSAGVERLQTPPDVIAPGVWQHVAATYDGATMRIYVDGIQKAGMSATGTIRPDSFDLPISLGRGWGTFWHGQLDQIEFYDRALTPFEIHSIVASAPAAPDADFDGVLDGADNCPLAANPGQQDFDGDTIGDACDWVPDSAWLQFSIAGYEVREGERSARVTVARSGGTSGPAASVSVELAAAGGSASSADHQLSTEQISFEPGETLKTVLITIDDDDSIEPDETLNLVLQNPSFDAELGPRSSAVLTIHDNDPNVSFAVSAGSSSESTQTIPIDVLLNATNGLPVTVNYTVTGTATYGQDHLLASGTLAFRSRTGIGNDGLRRIQLPVVDDSLLEPAETVVIRLTSPVNATLGPRDVYTHTIQANDVPPGHK